MLKKKAKNPAQPSPENTKQEAQSVKNTLLLAELRPKAQEFAQVPCFHRCPFPTGNQLCVRSGVGGTRGRCSHTHSLL